MRGLDAWITQPEPDPHRDCERCACGECATCKPWHNCRAQQLQQRRRLAQYRKTQKKGA